MQGGNLANPLKLVSSDVTMMTSQGKWSITSWVGWASELNWPSYSLNSLVFTSLTYLPQTQADLNTRTYLLNHLLKDLTAGFQFHVYTAVQSKKCGNSKRFLKHTNDSKR